ncbi:uncharacterized protein BCR38DRAFT_456899 [Pseudomassariella vexata]|uniref:ML-like domain-containing protein n=1 Tax=Pseudomassariella vexata TaxID=1141098 RepID=A0A1Y2E468_9PEZI|nr:uncharacterized protein BCR38DRAFT_456899 [Pseudomassariella vexata]ORY66322.1 hypothetical protein BCR38DRAFT_456899 [Pseudomassariella vexata]
MRRSNSRWGLKAVVLVAACAVGVLGEDVLTTSSFTNCDTNSSVRVDRVNISYNNDKKKVTFDVAGTSTKVQNVTAMLNVTAYGQQVYTNAFNPCEASTYVKQLCPVPSGTFSANGTQDIPEEYANQVPAIAFQVPDIAAQATLQLKALDDGSDVGCVQSQVTNGKTANVAAVSYIAAGVAGLAMVASGVGALGSALSGAAGAGSTGGAGTMSPSFTEIFGVFQGFAMNGMMSVNYPAVYRSFSKNFAFSTGLIPWTQMQMSIDDFRNVTGGNLTEDSVEFLQNATLVFPDGSTTTAQSSLLKRSVDNLVMLMVRDIDTTASDSVTTDNSTTSSIEASVRKAVSGIEGYVEQLSVPNGNTFMTVLLIVAIVIAVIIVGILLVKVVLEIWALFASFPKGLTGFRKHYWGSIARAITQLILLLYGIWVLYCIFQFTHGDSWAAKTLAGVTLALFTAVLAFFTYKIWSTAQKLKNAEGDPSGLYEDKDIWVKYSLFYESYKKSYWWLFVPAIVYMFAKGCILAIGDGHGMAQTIAQLIVEGCMMILLLWSRPFERKSSNVINIGIQVVRVLSVICILVFVEEFGIAETTQTVTGVVLIAVQSALTGILAILIVWNAILSCIKENPHRKRRKEMEKMQRDMDTLTPLDARNSLLITRTKSEGKGDSTFSMSILNESKQPLARNASPERYQGPREPTNPYAANDAVYNRPTTPLDVDQSRENLVSHAAPIGRQPSVPNVGSYGGGYNPIGYGQYRGNAY